MEAYGANTAYQNYQTPPAGGYGASNAGYTGGYGQQQGQYGGYGISSHSPQASYFAGAGAPPPQSYNPQGGQFGSVAPHYGGAPYMTQPQHPPGAPGGQPPATAETKGETKAAGDDKKTTGDDKKTAGDDKKTTGDDKKTTGDDKKASDSKAGNDGGSWWKPSTSIFGSSRYADPAKDPRNSQKSAGDDNKTTGDNKKTTGDDKKTTGDDKKTTGDDKKTTGDDKKTTGDDKKTTGDNTKAAENKESAKTSDQGPKSAPAAPAGPPAHGSYYGHGQSYQPPAGPASYVTSHDVYTGHTPRAPAFTPAQGNGSVPPDGKGSGLPEPRGAHEKGYLASLENMNQARGFDGAGPNLVQLRNAEMKETFNRTQELDGRVVNDLLNSPDPQIREETKKVLQDDLQNRQARLNELHKADERASMMAQASAEVLAEMKADQMNEFRTQARAELRGQGHVNPYGHHPMQGPGIPSLGDFYEAARRGAIDGNLQTHEAQRHGMDQAFARRPESKS